MSSPRGADGRANLDESQNASTSNSLRADQNRSSHNSASVAAAEAAQRERELGAATRRQQMSNGKLYAQNVRAAEHMSGAAPTGAMHDAALLGAQMTPLMSERISGLQNEYAMRAEKASDMALHAAAREGQYNMGLPMDGTAIGGMLRGMAPEQQRGPGKSSSGSASKAGSGSKSGRDSTSSVGSGGGRSSGAPPLPQPDENSFCNHCGTKETPGWRVGPTPGERLCNACGLYYMKNDSMRPKNLFKKRANPRKRKAGAKTNLPGIGSNPPGIGSMRSGIGSNPPSRLSGIPMTPSDGASSVLSNGSRRISPSPSMSNSPGAVAANRMPPGPLQPSPFPMENSALGVSAVMPGAGPGVGNGAQMDGSVNSFGVGNVASGPIPSVSEFFMSKGQAGEQQGSFHFNGAPNLRGVSSGDGGNNNGNSGASVFPPMLPGMEIGGDGGGARAPQGNLDILMPGIGDDKLAPVPEQQEMGGMSGENMDSGLEGEGDASNDLSAQSGQEMLNSLFGGGNDGGSDFAF